MSSLNLEPGDISEPDVKWWVKQHGLEKGHVDEQLNVLDRKVKVYSDGLVNGDAEARAENQLIEDYFRTYYHGADATFPLGEQLKDFGSLAKQGQESSWLQELEAKIDEDLAARPDNKYEEDFWLSNAHLMDLYPSFLEQPRKLCSALDSHWIKVDKIAPPRYAASDKSDLSSLVSWNSSQHIENHDLPKIQCKHFEKRSLYCISMSDEQEQMKNSRQEVSKVADCSQGNFASTSVDKLSTVGCLQGSDEIFRGKTVTPMEEGSSDTKQVNDEYSRAQLLEALCHSQTRAREAELLAQQAYDEKENVVNLFFRQASYLFAYRQWFRILQLETLCLQLRDKHQLDSVSSPALLSPVQRKGGIIRKTQHVATNKKQPGSQPCKINKCSVAFAVGLTLAGAGFLVGWTIGWLFPVF